MDYSSDATCSTELQGHAIKNQDLLIASGAISLKGSEGLSAVDEDIEAASAVSIQSSVFSGLFSGSSLTLTPKTLQSRSGVLSQDVLTNDLDLRRRDRELTEIAKSIASLAELFKDLSALVIDQGTLLDSVEYNIEQTAVQMEEAVKELDMATRYVGGLFPRLDSTSPSRFPPSYRLIIDVE